jgi:O-Antigen ligase
VHVLDKIRNIGLQGFILFAPFTAWLSLTGWLRPPIDFLLIALLASTGGLLARLVRRPATLFTAQEDVLLLALVALGWVSFSLGSLTPKSFNHAFSYTFVVGAVVILYKRMWLDAGLSMERLFKMAFYAVLVADLIVVVEWSLLNFFYILIRQYFIIAQNVTNMDYYDQSFFKSVGGTSEEPSLFCYNVNALFPLGWYYLLQKGKQGRAALFVALHMLTLVMTASSGGIGFMVIALCVAYGMEARGKQLVNLAWGFLLSGLGVFIIYNALPIEIKVKADAFSHQITSKMTFENTSADMREEAWGKGIADFEASPLIGRGPAYGHEAYNMFGYQSWYWKLLAETGLFSLLVVWGFLAVIGYRILKIKQPLRRFLIISFTASVLHWAIADAYYHISFWIVVCAIQMMHLEREKARAGVHQAVGV